ncbi:hypothetical protein [Candidatus Borrarchaeum sp.]|uniref:hypothetical protein n=1 Tax=Candidatus Borrarchaeum sp. TaxID=2846742 RepID=UPI00257C88E6|nr:hypothetical protein [Candidatus Borrarchaeum sp.]
MSQIIMSQPRNPVTATYVILGSAIAYVIFWNFSQDIVSKLLIISVIGGMITSSLYFLEPIQFVDNRYLRNKYEKTILRDFKEYTEVTFENTFKEPYFDADRNNIYGSLYLSLAICVGAVGTIFINPSVPIWIPVISLFITLTLLINGIYLITLRTEKIELVHYILSLERYTLMEKSDIGYPYAPIEKIKIELASRRWVSARNILKQHTETVYARLRNIRSKLQGNKWRWQNTKITVEEIKKGFGSNSPFEDEVKSYLSNAKLGRTWLFLLDLDLREFSKKLDELASFLQAKKMDLVSILHSKTIIKIMESKKKDLSYFYSDETFSPDKEVNYRNLQESLTGDDIPSLIEVKEAIIAIKGLKPTFDEIIQKIEAVEDVHLTVKKND